MNLCPVLNFNILARDIYYVKNTKKVQRSIKIIGVLLDESCRNVV